MGQRFPEIGVDRDYGDRTLVENKALVTKTIEEWWAFLTAAGWCLISWTRYGTLSRFIRVFNAVTIQNFSIEDALHAGERVYNLKRQFNIKHGITGKEDSLPQRLLTEPNRKSGNTVVKLNKTLPEYLKLRGWYKS